MSLQPKRVGGAAPFAPRRRSMSSIAIGLTSLILVASCGQEPEVEVEIGRNSFSYLGSFDGAADDETLIWPVSGSRALVDWEGTAVTEGEFALTILDAEGAQVYFGRAVFGPPAREVTAAGVPGDWRLQISYTRLEGTVAVTAVAIIE